MRSNCYAWARAEYARREAEWVAAGCPAGREPYWIERRSRLDPRWMWHFAVGSYDPATDSIKVQSFKPCDIRPLPLWRLLSALWTRGFVTQGDTP